MTASAECCSYAATTDWPADVSRLVYERLEAFGLAGRSVLEVGCGYGRIVVGAALAGATRTTGIELDPDAVDRTRLRAERAGVGDRCEVVVGDGATMPLTAHDVVVLDRVICCYADGERLVRNTIGAARAGYAISVPESRGLRGVVNRFRYLFRTNRYVHDVRRINALLGAAGFSNIWAGRSGKWYVGLYQRSQPVSPSGWRR